jgi:hypothetical protein
MRLPPEIHAIFGNIVYDGILAYSGMSSFRDVMGPTDVVDVQNYLKSQTNSQIDAAQGGAK